MTSRNQQSTINTKLYYVPQTVSVQELTCYYTAQNKYSTCLYYLFFKSTNKCKLTKTADDNA